MLINTYKLSVISILTDRDVRREFDCFFACKAINDFDKFISLTFTMI